MMKKQSSPSVNLSIYSFIAFVMTAIPCSDNVFAEEFQQAYAPISVGDIGFMIPIERQPSESGYFATTDGGDSWILEWEAVSGATRYKIEYFKDGVWQAISSDEQSNRINVAKDKGTEFRVSACDVYGCSDWVGVTTRISGPVLVNRFSKSSDITELNQSVVISWDVSSATKITVSSSNGNEVISYSGLGSHSFPVTGLTQFRMIAEGFNGSIEQSIFVSPTKSSISQEQPTQDRYLQPILRTVIEAGMQPIEKALVTLIDGVEQINVFPQYSEVITRVSNSGDIIWEAPTDGLVVNKPIYLVDNKTLIYSVSSDINRGKVCRINIDGTQRFCLDRIEGSSFLPIVSSPLYINGSILFVDSFGSIYEVSKNLESSTLKLLGRVSLEQGDTVVSTPVFDPQSDELVVRTKYGLLIGIPLSIGTPSLMTKSKSLFRTFDYSSSGSLSPRWQRSLNLAGDNQ
ncbi:hypothetical protein L2725_12840 [Shewanella corallii]|uniref:Uncharacterized protein n=1 Tax=Shewanella corallii TaxID=560080 RepID=A0ABT0N8F8_9GAMM|nr:hypothetical protein [Shewanella corallii]MCL2914655.1 hypothetical protein [Shewanella corallii]